jgi:hypothetical protein
MKLLQPGPGAAPFGLRAMVMVARAARNGLGQPQRAMLEAAQRLVLETDLDVDNLPAIAPEELASRFADPALARQLVRGMVAMSLADGPPSCEQIALITKFAIALRVDEPAVKVVRHLMKKQMLKFRLSFYRRSHVRIYLRNTYRLMGGILPMIKTFLAARGLIRENKEMAARFRALGNLPQGTLGYEFFHHYTGNGFSFPGEKDGFPVGALFHDFGHVLAGYDTSPEGELKEAAFQAGFTRDEDDFFTILFAILIHTAGVNVAPFEMPRFLGRIGQGELAADILEALRRGAAMKVDLSDSWDFWKYVDLPIEVARERLGVPPLPAQTHDDEAPPQSGISASD